MQERENLDFVFSGNPKLNCFCQCCNQHLQQGGHKPGKHGKPGKLREFEKLSKSQGKLMEITDYVKVLT